MTKIVVSKRDGIVTAPDGTKHRVHRGKTLADAEHPIVLAYPHDWSPIEVQLITEGTPAPEAEGDTEALEELRNDLAEAEELAEVRGTELVHLIKSLTEVSALVEQHGELPPEAERGPGWLVAAVSRSLQAAYGRGRNDAEPKSAPAPAAGEPAPPSVPAPRPPRAPKQKPPANA